MKNSVDKKGVTLTELMVVLAIIGIAAAIAVPSMGDWIARMKLNAESRKVYSVFQLARSEAIRNGQNVVVGIIFGANYGDTRICACVGTWATANAWMNGGVAPARIIIPITRLPRDIKIFWPGEPEGYPGLTTWEYTSRGTLIPGDDAQPIDIGSSRLPTKLSHFTFTLGGSVNIQ